MKRFISTILSSILLVSMLSGCGVKDNSGTTTDTSTDTQTTTEDTAEETVKETADDTAEETTEEVSALPEMTTEDITLTYVHFDNEPLVDYLAEKFMEKYPNITVETAYYPADGEYNNTLLNMVNNGETPDVMMILGNCDFALYNQLLGDMTEYWENDPENENILPTINEAKIGYYGTDMKLASPMKFFPDAIYADMAVFEKLNVEMPPTDWTWDEMVQSFKDVTSPSDGIYGFNQFHSIVTYYPVAADPNAIGEFGWDGTSFNMGNWATGVNTWAELVNGKFHAPFFDTDENEAWLGDRLAWAGSSGKLGYQVDAWWTYLNLFDTEEWIDKGIEFVPYTTPTVEGSGSENVFGVLDMGGISSGTEYPREAYELLKWMGWSAEGWTHKLEAYNTLTSADGIELYRQSMPLPITLDETIWDGIKEFYPSATKENPTEADLKYGPYFDDFFEKCIRVIPFGDTQIPGFVNFINEAYAGVEDAVRLEGKNAADYVTELEEKANQYNQDAMSTAFGY